MICPNLKNIQTRKLFNNIIFSIGGEPFIDSDYDLYQSNLDAFNKLYPEDKMKFFYAAFNLFVDNNGDLDVIKEKMSEFGFEYQEIIIV